MEDLTIFLLVIGKLSSAYSDSLGLELMSPECVSSRIEFGLVSCTSSGCVCCSISS